MSPQFLGSKNKPRKNHHEEGSKQDVPPQCQLSLNRLPWVISQKIELLVCVILTNFIYRVTGILKVGNDVTYSWDA
jgi:hypothetical protein